MSRILIADDDQDVLECLQVVLGEAHEIVVAANGEDALNKAAGTPFDLILLDLMMPLVSGGDVVRRLRATGVTAPIIIASAADDLQHKVVDLPVDDHIAKPYDFDALEKKITAWIAHT